MQSSLILNQIKLDPSLPGGISKVDTGTVKPLGRSIMYKYLGPALGKGFESILDEC